ncbi:MAG: GNAT family N-acetyltransferase [Lachnospiraceae bacterium]|nr:GNAT family N-acetyltransferase [Lachnospiraceae bacterium]
MNIRRATESDIPAVLKMLSQVLELHADIRPDIFIPNTTKYSAEDLSAMFLDDSRPVYVAEDDGGVCGYAFCQLQDPPFTSTMIPHKIMYLDDLCVDESARGKHVGSALFEHVKSEAKRLGCYEVTLNVWEGNDKAINFYRFMGMKTKETQMEYILE